MTLSGNPLTNTIAPTVVARARIASQRSGRSITAEIESELGTPQRDFLRALADTFGYRSATLAEVSTWRQRFDRVPFAEAVQRKCVLAADHAGREVIVFADPFCEDLSAWRQFRHPLAEPVLLHPLELTTWLDRAELELRAMPLATRARGQIIASDPTGEVLSLARIGSDSSPIIQFVNSSLYDALKAGASDIHLESTTDGLSVKFRLDGVLNLMGHTPGVALAEQVLSRIKVMAELDIAERRVPQDGRLQVVIGGRPVDVRVSIMPSIHGEDAVLRILDRKALADDAAGLSLTSLGFGPELGQAIHKLAALPYGMLLVTGPTGSGKTTTLYAALTETHDAQAKTITIEDPVEYQLPGILQIPVHEKKGLTFARGLRSILRHDPDRILVGEIRDAETAQIAVQSALTGHLVLTTVHANGVLDIFGRFAQFGIDPYSFVAALNGVLAQRLLRRLCPNCAQPCTPDLISIREADPQQALRLGQWRRATGCAECRGVGYRGRFAIGEILKLNSTLRSLIAERASLHAIESAAREAGLVSLRSQALDMAAAGVTSLEEVNRVTAV